MTEADLLAELLRTRSLLDWTLRVLEHVITDGGTWPKTLDEREHLLALMQRALAETAGNRAEAARLLGIARQTLHTRIKEAEREGYVFPDDGNARAARSQRGRRAAGPGAEPDEGHLRTVA